MGSTSVPPEWVNTLPVEKAMEPDSWPPRSDNFFDWENWTTHEAYHDPKLRGGSAGDFLPEFSLARSRLDYEYHLLPACSRQELQDAILSRVVRASEVGGAPLGKQALDASDVTPAPGLRGSRRRRPWIVFTAGAMGVGKGYTLSTLHKSGLFSLDTFLKIDPDMIKSELPEISGYLRSDPESAATKVHRESTQMADVLFEHAVSNRTPAIIDGSLRDVTYYESLFDRIRSEYPEYRIGILHVTAPRDVIHARAKKRAERTGRDVPTELLDESIEQVPRSVRLLSPRADASFEISNDDGAPLRLVASSTPSGGSGGGVEGSTSSSSATSEGGSWEDFASTWTDGEFDGDDEQGEEGKQKDEDRHADDASAPAIAVTVNTAANKAQKKKKKQCCLLKPVCIGGMANCWTDCAAHDAARAVWGEAYPNVCPRCTLSGDGQCGVCIHGRHLCACKECESVCPVRRALRSACASKKKACGWFKSGGGNK